MPIFKSTHSRLVTHGTPEWAEDLGPSSVSCAWAFKRALTNATKWASVCTMEDMGITAVVGDYLEAMELRNLHTFSHPTYEEPTLQFFSTFQLKEPIRNEGCPAYSTLVFYLDKSRYEIYVQELCGFFGFPNETEKSYGTYDKAWDLWTLMTGEKWKADDARSVMIKNPVIRYTARLLSNTVFARVDLSKVHLLFRGLAKTLGDNVFEDHAVNNVYLFPYELSSFKERLMRQKNPPTLCFGGMLTPIFLHIGIDLSQYTMVLRESEMYLPYLCSIKACGRRTCDGIIHLWKLRSRQLECTLPMPDYSTPTSRDTIAFRVPEGRRIPHVPHREPERHRDPSRDSQLDQARAVSWRRHQHSALKTR